MKVTFKPWEEVIIHDNIHRSFDDFIKLCSIGVQPGGLAAPLHWAEGIVLRPSPMPPTESATKEMLEGKIHWLAVEWSEMPKYQPIIMIGDINAKIPVVNASDTAIICDVAKVLKATLITTKL